MPWAGLMAGWKAGGGTVDRRWWPHGSGVARFSFLCCVSSGFPCWSVGLELRRVLIPHEALDAAVMPELIVPLTHTGSR